MASRPLPTDSDSACGLAVPSPEPAFTADRWQELRGDTTLAGRWADLAANASQPNPFFSHWALTPALDSIESAGRIRLACLDDGRQMDGLLPLKRETMYYGRPIPHWRSWCHHNAFCGAPLVRPGQEHRFWTELLRGCDEHAGGALFLHLVNLPQDGTLYAALRDVVAAEQRPAAIVHREERALLQSALSPEDYLAASLTPKKRKELRRQHRRLAEEGVLAFETTRSNAGLDRWIDQFLALERAGWKGSKRSALACSPETATIFRETLTGAARAGVLERLILTLDQQPIAMLVNLLTPPGAFSYKTTYDEAYARFSPGVLLQLENLALLNNQDIAWTDSCAAPDHPMIGSIWRERRTMLRVSIAIGGHARRLLASTVISAEAWQDGQGL